MGKILSWVLIGLLGWLVWHFVVVSQRRSARAARQGDTAGAARPAEPESMVSCEHCGLHVPASEAVADGSLMFCCAAHRDAHRR